MTRLSWTKNVRFSVCLTIATAGFSACFTPVSVDPQKIHCQVPDDCPAGYVCSSQGSCCKAAGDPLCGKTSNDGAAAETSGDAQAKDGVALASTVADSNESDLGRPPIEGATDAGPADGTGDLASTEAQGPAPDLRQPDTTLDLPPPDVPKDEDVSADISPDTRPIEDLASEVVRDVPPDFPPDSASDLARDLARDLPADLPPDLPAPAALGLAPQSQAFDAVTAGNTGVGVTFTLRNDGGSAGGTTVGVNVTITGTNAP